MRKLIALILCAVTMVTAAACQKNTPETEETEKILNIGWPYEPSALDPTRASDDASYRLVCMITESLLRNVNDEVQPGAAESYDVSGDHMEYVFHLRQDNVFSDGTPITAEDFRYSIQRLLDPEKSNENAVTGYVIKNGEAFNLGKCGAEELGIEVVDDFTLKLTMEYPTYPFTFTRWEFSPVNQAKSEEQGVTYGTEAENMLTNGPFTVTSWVHDSELVLEKNEKYWNADAIKLDKIVCIMNVMGDTAVDMLQAGELDMADMNTMIQVNTMTGSGFKAVQNNSGIECVHINHAGSTEETGLFLSNTNFRKALNYAIDRDALVASAYTNGVAATRLASPSEVGVEVAFVDEYEYEPWGTSADTEKAQECLKLALEELGKTVEDIPVFTILCYDSESNMTAMNAVMDMWNKALGINCQIDAQTIQNMLQKMYSGEFDFWKGSIVPSGPDMLGYAAYYITDGGRFHYDNETFDKMYTDAKYAETWQARKDVIFEMEKYMCENVIDLYVIWPSVYFVYSPSVTGVTVNVHAVDPIYADISG